jgi:murein DD-endopeptidase MepM/ murein hydrolase activator NlpD
MKTASFILFLLMCFFLSCNKPSVPSSIRVVTELNLGESKEIILTDGTKVMLTLHQVELFRDSLRGAIREVRVTVEVNGVRVVLGSGNYHLPMEVGGVQIDCPVVKAYYSNSNEDRWGLTGDARFRLWPAGSSLMEPGTFVYPLKQRWFASMTQSGNEPPYVDWGEDPNSKNIYYHSGHDFGGAEGRDEILSAMEGLVISAKGDTLDGTTDIPGDVRKDVVWVLSDLGWVIRYSHLDSIFGSIQPGARVKLGQPIGLMGKQGGSGGWVHLHFELKTRETASGAWGTEEAYAYLWEAYIGQYEPKVVAVARPHHLAWTGQSVRLDGSKSKSMTGSRLSHEWTFTDGSAASGAVQERIYDEPGEYSEILKVTDAEGNVDYDFAVVQVYERTRPTQTIPVLQPSFYPSLGIKSGDPVTFLVRTFNSQVGLETWDFGDGTPKVSVRSEPPTRQNYTEGKFAETAHTYGEPGRYIVKVERSDSLGQRAVGHLQVVVEE